MRARRRFLAALIAATGAALTRSWGGTGPIEPRGALLAMLDDRRGAQAIGRAYLRTLSLPDRRPERLVAAICGAATLDGNKLASPDLARRIGDQIRHDFSQAAVVRVDGWFLSETEARLYALAASA